MYLQYLVGLSSFTTKESFDRSLLVIIRYRLGQDVMEEFNKLVLQQAGLLDCPDGKELVAAVKLHPSIRNEIYTGKETGDICLPLRKLICSVSGCHVTFSVFFVKKNSENAKT